MKLAIAPREIMTVLFKHKAKIAVAFIATIVTVLIGTFLLSPVYESTASLLIKFGREYVYTPQVGDDKPASPPRTEMLGMINAETQIFTSPDLVDQVIRTVGLKNLYPKLAEKGVNPDVTADAARQTFLQNLTVVGLPESGVIQVSFQHTDPKMSANVVNKMIDLYKQKHLDAFIDPKTSGFLDEKAKAFRTELEATETRLSKLRMQHSAFDIEKQRELLLGQRTELDAAYKESQNQIAEFGKKLSALKAQEASITQQARGGMESNRYGVLDDAKSKLLDLQLQEQQALKKYTETSQTVRNLREQIATVKTFMGSVDSDLKTATPGGDPVYQELQRQILTTKADFQSEQAKSAVMKRQLGEIDADLKNLSQPENAIADLQRQVVTQEKNYEVYAQKLEEARMNEELNRAKMTNVSVIQTPSVPVLPVKPRPFLNLLIGIVMGSLIGLGIAFLAEFLSQTVSTSESLERRLGLPVLAVVPVRAGYPTR